MSVFVCANQLANDVGVALAEASHAKARDGQTHKGKDQQNDEEGGELFFPSQRVSAEKEMAIKCVS